MRHSILLISALSVALSAGLGDRAAGAEKGLVGYWAFDKEDGARVIDSSPNGNDGKMPGATYVDGVAGKALSFGEENSSVEIDPSPSFNFEKAMTISAWIFPKEEYYTVGCIRGPRGCMGVMKLKSMMLSICAMSATEHEMLDSSVRIPKDEWVHVAITYDGKRMATYINGEESSARDANVDFTLKNGSFLIGRNTDAERPDYFRGKMDEVRVYNRALPASEIMSLYKQVTPDRK